jgi:hypothetical protein
MAEWTAIVVVLPARRGRRCIAVALPSTGAARFIEHLP